MVSLDGSVHANSHYLVIEPPSTLRFRICFHVIGSAFVCFVDQYKFIRCQHIKNISDAALFFFYRFSTFVLVSESSGVQADFDFNDELLTRKTRFIRYVNFKIFFSFAITYPFSVRRYMPPTMLLTSLLVNTMHTSYTTRFSLFLNFFIITTI